MRRVTTFVLAIAVSSPAIAQESKWAGDPEGGAPFVEADPARPDRLVGFDVEVARGCATRVLRVQDGAVLAG